MNNFFDEKQIYLIGFMGAGKTTVGKLLAQKLRRPFLDIDDLIEQQTHLTIAAIFEQCGEGYFRQRETAALEQSSRTPVHVIATGGGIILKAENRKLLKETGITIYLKWRPEVLFRRLKNHSHRPLLQGMNQSQLAQQIEAMLKQRQSFYEEADFIIEASERMTPDAIVESIHQQLHLRTAMSQEQ